MCQAIYIHNDDQILVLEVLKQLVSNQMKFVAYLLAPSHHFDQIDLSQENAYNRMAWQWAETLVEIRGTLVDIRGTNK